MKRLCFGGSFNPIHHAHLICARAVAEAKGFERVVLIPANQPPHKPDAVNMAPAEDRLAMCRLAVEGSSLFEVDDLELGRDRRSYTIDTARVLKAGGWPEVHWLIGADMAHTLPLWHEPEALLREVKFVIMARPGSSFDWEALPPLYRGLRERVVVAPLIDISATDIRSRVAADKSIDYLTAPAVVEYIQWKKLYR